MLPPTVCGVLTVVLAAVVVWCAYSVIRGPTGSTRDHVPVDVEAWHGVMGAAMLPLLRWTPSADWAWLGCGLFAVMVLISGISLVVGGIVIANIMLDGIYPENLKRTVSEEEGVII